jgi:hypothetical protein
MAKATRETRVALKSVIDGDTVISVLSEDAAQKRIETAKKDGKPEPEVVKMQSFIYHEAEKSEDFASLIPDEEERVNIFNTGFVLKQQRVDRGLMTDDEWKGQDGDYDLLADAQSKTERQKASPQDKALRAVAKALAEMSPDQQKEYFAKLTAQFAGAGSEAQPAASAA